MTQRLLPHRLLVSLCTLGLLTACAHSTRYDARLEKGPPEGPVSFALDARFSLQFRPLDAPIDEAPTRLSGRLLWQHRPEQDELLFSNPLGQGMARLERNAGQAILEQADGARIIAASEDELLERALGVAMSLDELIGWLIARPGVGALVERDPQGRPVYARESGWMLTYHYEGEARLPSRLDASLDSDRHLKLRLVVDNWETLSAP